MQMAGESGSTRERASGKVLYRRWQAPALGILPDLIRELVGPNPCIIAERIETVDFLTLDELGSASHWKKGRAFSADAELRWAFGDHGSLQAHLLTEQEHSMPEGWRPASDQGFDVGDDVQLCLWGERDRSQGEKAWREVRIPRLLRYPCDALGRVVILATVYSRNGVALLTRLKGVKAAS